MTISRVSSLKKQKKFKERTKVIRFPVYLNYKVVFVVTNDKRKTHSRIARRHNLASKYDGYEAVHLWVETSKESISYLIFGPRAQVGTVSHEAWHCVRRICDWTGASLDNETVGYHIGYLTEVGYNFIKRS